MLLAISLFFSRARVGGLFLQTRIYSLDKRRAVGYAGIITSQIFGGNQQ